MLERLANSDQVESAKRDIAEVISAHAEWFITQSDSSTEAIRRQELDLAPSHGRLILSSWTEKGTRSWKIVAWEWTGRDRRRPSPRGHDGAWSSRSPA